MKGKITLFQNKIYWLFAVGLFLILALPLLSISPWFYPPDWGKTIIFRTVLSVLFFVFLAQLLIFQQRGRASLIKLIKAQKAGFGLLILLFLVFLLSTIFSQDPFYSFWGDAHRAGGFLNFAFYIIFALFLFLFLDKANIVPKNKFLNWQRIWDFSIIIGALVALLAIFQQYGIFREVFIYSGRPPSTIGSSVLLALYLLLLTFLTLSFGLGEKNPKKKIFYFATLLFFLFVILFTTQSRTAYLGLLAGFCYFLFPYPGKKIIWLKVLAVLFLITLIYGIYYVNTEQQLPKFLEENKMFQKVLPRLSIGLARAEPRYSVWLISLEAIKERPLLGYGLENFSIAFDKHYDPFLPLITRDWGSWYDRAHNVFFDLAVTTGLLGLVAYLSLFAFLFWQLQKTKRKNFHTPEYESQGRKSGEEKKIKAGENHFLICHGIQATFLAYLVANSFSFDTFSSYLILFLLVAFSLTLTNLTKQKQGQKQGLNPCKLQGFNPCKSNNFWWSKGKNIFPLLKKAVPALVLFCLIWFVWAFNLKPLYVNKEINIGLATAKTGNWPHALKRMEKILPTKTFLNHYLRMKYAEVINISLNSTTARPTNLAEDGIKVLKENTKIRPTYTRDWLYLGIYSNFLTDKLWEQKPAKAQRTKQEADAYFQEANRLSPKRQEVFVEWAKSFLVSADYQKAKEKAKECLALNPSLGECWWLKGLARIYLGEKEEAQEDLKRAQENRYETTVRDSLFQLIETYLQTKNYQELIEIHQKLIEKDPTNPQYYATLAHNYKIIGDYEKARETAEKILELFPEMKDKVEEFLKTLPY